jgi:hypothetical protein
LKSYSTSNDNRAQVVFDASGNVLASTGAAVSLFYTVSWICKKIFKPVISATGKKILPEKPLLRHSALLTTQLVNIRAYLRYLATDTLITQPGRKIQKRIWIEAALPLNILHWADPTLGKKITADVTHLD